MPEFEYQGVDRSGKKIVGKMNVPTEGDLRMMLRTQGVRPTKISKVGVLQSDLGSLLGRGSTKVSLQALMFFTRQLHVLINSGVPVIQALDILFDQSADKGLQVVIGGIREKVSGGAYLWESMSAYPQVFPKLYLSLIRAGESSGSIDQMLKRLTRYLEDSNRLRKILKGASFYPIVVLCIGTAIFVGMLVFVVPQFAEMLQGSNKPIPPLTQFVLDLSANMKKNFGILVVTVGVTAYLLTRYLKSDEGRAFMHRFTFNMPLFGPLIQKGAIARFSRTMNTLLTSGVTLLDAIEICKGSIDNIVLEETISRIRTEVEGGKPFGAVISRVPVFPKMVSQMITIGESTGNLDKMLEKVADFYEEEVEVMVAGLTKLIEPVLIVMLAVMVGGILMAVYLPVMQSAGSAMGG